MRSVFRRGTCAALLLAGTTATGALAAVLDNPIPEPIEKTGPQVSLETVASGFVAPVWGTSAPGVSNRLFVVDQVGKLYSVNLATGAKSVFLDVGARLVPLGLFGINYDERGFLGVAFHPQYQSNGKLYTYTSEPVNGLADFSTLEPGQTADHQNVLIEWTVPSPANPSSPPGNPRVLLRIDWPQFNHDGGALNFGPDGFLYISCGDGGGADDENAGHGLIGNGQDPTSALGKILRIDPAGNNASNGQYGIPAQNPFAGRSGYVQEIYAYGLRNPFRFSFDATTGKLYAGDVGQNRIEEVDIVVRGGNYGWSIKEGTFCFDRNGTGPGQVTDAPACGPLGLVEPIAEYDHDEGIAIIGGFVYRGARVHELRGRYIFGDYARQFGANNGRLFTLAGKSQADNGDDQGKGNVRKGLKQRQIQELQLPTALNRAVLGFGQDATGEIYVLTSGTGVVSGTTGLVQRLAPAH
jgi:glucose/arabinose dehydrogenase